MNQYSAKALIFICITAASLAADQVFAENGRNEYRADLNAKQLLSEKQAERTMAFEWLSAQYREESATLLKLLEKASVKYRVDRRYQSPLHAVILAIDAWRVLESDTTLLSIVDYELDSSSLPLGIDVTGDYFYPAARTLVRLRVDIVKVVEMIEAEPNQTKLRLLTWVLLERAGNIENATICLNNSGNKRHGNTQKLNIDKAIELLKHPSDLLPLPSKGGQHHPSSP